LFFQLIIIIKKKKEAKKTIFNSDDECEIVTIIPQHTKSIENDDGYGEEEDELEGGEGHLKENNQILNSDERFKIDERFTEEKDDYYEENYEDEENEQYNNTPKSLKK
jgi:hypothetical protein